MERLIQIEKVEPNLAKLIRNNFRGYNPRLTIDLGSALQVGWDQTEILPANSGKTVILTRRVNCCFAVIGENQEGDAVMGHFFPITDVMDGFARVENRFRRHNPNTNLSRIAFEIIYGPEYHSYLKPSKESIRGYYDIYYIPGRGKIMFFNSRG